MRVTHPLPGADPNSSPPASFGGYPLVSTGGGALIADDSTHRFLGVINGFPTSRWHRDVYNYLGVPAAEGDTVFTGLGGSGGATGLAAIDSMTGRDRWIFAPEGLPRDAQGSRIVPMSRWTRQIAPRGGVRSDPQTTEGLRALTEQILREGVRERISSERVKVPQAISPLLHGYWTSAGLVLVNGRVFGEVSGSIASLDQRTGSPFWRTPLPERAFVRSLVAAADHLLLCFSVTPQGQRVPLWDHSLDSRSKHFLLALRLDNGKEVWKEEISRPGTLALSDGLVYLANGDLIVLGPAERTYHLAEIDRPGTTSPGQSGVPEGPYLGCEVSPDAVPSPVGAPRESSTGIGIYPDAALLRLTFDTPVDAALQRVLEAKSRGEARTLKIQLDWLDQERRTLRGVAGGKWTPQTVRAFAAYCTRIAQEAQPEYFDLAPDVNVYLARHPEQADTVRGLILEAARSIRGVAAGCKVLVSLNVETLYGYYGQGTWEPLGAPPHKGRERPYLEGILSVVDAVGLTSYPQAAFRNSGQIPTEYLLGVRKLVPEKPLLVTRMAVQADATKPEVRAEQAAHLERLRLACYWLDARIVVRPELIGYQPMASATGSEDRDPLYVAQEKWRRQHGWKHVHVLSVKPPEIADTRLALTARPYASGR